MLVFLFVPDSGDLHIYKSIEEACKSLEPWCLEDREYGEYEAYIEQAEIVELREERNAVVGSVTHRRDVGGLLSLIRRQFLNDARSVNHADVHEELRRAVDEYAEKHPPRGL
jgi:hypothetical protein